MPTAKVMISVPQPFLQEVDRIAQEERLSRSELLRKAMRLYIESRRASRVPGRDPGVRAAVAIQDSLGRHTPGDGEDSSADLRRWRDSRR